MQPPGLGAEASLPGPLLVKIKTVQRRLEIMSIYISFRNSFAWYFPPGAICGKTKSSSASLRPRSVRRKTILLHSRRPDSLRARGTGLPITLRSESIASTAVAPLMSQHSIIPSDSREKRLLQNLLVDTGPISRCAMACKRASDSGRRTNLLNMTILRPFKYKRMGGCKWPRPRAKQNVALRPGLGLPIREKRFCISNIYSK